MNKFLQVFLATVILTVGYPHSSVLAQAPGGVNSNLKLWLKANTGVNASGTSVTSWTDQTGNSTNVITGNNTSPQLVAGVLNNNPVVRFSGTNNRGLKGTFNTANITSSSLNAFIVTKVKSANSGSAARVFAIYGTGTNANDYDNNNSANLFYRDGSDIKAQRSNTTLAAVTSVLETPQLLSNSFVNNTFSIYKNGVLKNTSSFGSQSFNSKYYTLGVQNGNTNVLDGDIAEVILYAGTLTAAEKNRIDSYLATKYGFTLDQTTPTNYVINGSTIVWNAASNSAGYNNNITGIGKSTASGLEQLKSETINPDSIVTISAASFADENYFFIGDNGQAGTLTTGGITGFTSIAKRIWNVQTTGAVPAVTFTVDLNRAGVTAPYGGFTTSTVRMLVSSSATFTGATPITPTSITNNIATFSVPAGTIANGNFFTFGLAPAPGYVYVHLKALNEEASVDFSYSILGGASSVSNFVLNDKAELLNVFDLGASHGANGTSIGDGQLWAIAGAPGSTTPNINTSTAGSPHTSSANHDIYLRANGTATWVATSQQGFTLDGAGYNTMVYANVAGNGYFYTYGGSANLIYNQGSYSNSKLKDVAYGGGTTVAVNGSGHILVYTGTYANNSDSWTDISGSNAAMVAERIDILPSTRKIIFQNSSGNVSTVNIDGTGLVSLGKPNTGTPQYRDVCFDDNGNIYATFREPVSGNDHVYDYIGGVWTLNPQSRICNSLTGTAGGQVWAVNFQDGSGQNAIFTRTTDGTRTWLNDERVRVTSKGNSAMIAVAPGTYTITQTMPSGWDLNNITHYDPSPNSTTSVASNIATVKVNSGEIVHSVFTNENIILTTIANSCDVQNLQDFGSGPAQYGTPVTGSTSYHYTASVVPQDGLYTLEKNAVGVNNWWIQGTQFINGDHTTGPGGNGYFMLINASYSKDEFYRQRVRGLIIGQEYQLSIWAANVSVGTQINPNILFGIADVNSGNTMGSLSTGEITHGYWTQYTFFFTATKTTADIFLRNNAIGGNGNDLVIDDITLNLPPSSFAAPITGSSVVCSNTLSSFQFNTTSTTGVWSLSNNLLGVLSNPTGSSVTFTPTVGATGTCTITYTITTGACVSSSTKDVTLDNNCTIGTRTISGKVMNDGNGLSDNTVNGAGTNGGGLNAVVYNNTTGKIQAVMAVPADGTFSFSGLPNSQNYSVIITTVSYTAGTTMAKPVSVLPNNYGSVGENYSAAAGSDGNANGIIDLGIVSTNVNQADFGIEQRPTANPSSNTYPNPGGTATRAVPTLTGSDPEDGVYNGNSLTTKVQIVSLPTNGILYYNGALVTAGQLIPSYEPVLLTIDPNSGNVVTAFTFSEIDSAGLASPPATVTMTFTVPSISGSVWDDANGNATRESGELFITNGSLWANLVDPTTHAVLESVQVDNAGNYLLDETETNKTYQIILTTTNQTNNTNLTASNVPTGWVNTGVNLSGAANTTNQTGIISVTTVSSNITAQNFALEQLPVAGGGSNTAANPGGTASALVPANTFTNTSLSTDADGAVTNIRITALPVGATSITINNVIYTSITFPVNGVTVPTDASGNPTQVISIDPSFNSTGTINIPFVAIDNAGRESTASGTAVMNFTQFTITGSVWNDTNGNAVKDGAEPFITNGTVYANLVNPTTHAVVQSVVVDGSGNYAFLNVLANTAYEIILTNNSQAVNANLTAATLPTGFANTGTNLNGTASTSNTTGIVSLTTGTNSTASQNFGIEKLPTAGSGSNTAVNQGGTATTNVPANTFTNTTNSSDPDGNVASIRITTFPTGADKIIINGVPYTSTNFPAGGVTIPTDANGNPTQTINVDPSFTGAGSVIISFVAIDNASKESANTGTATMNFSALTVTGSVWNDTNGNAVKDGAEPFITNGSVYANLVDPVSHDVIQSVVVDASGNYSFSGVPANTAYQIILTTSSQTGNTNLTTSTLPTGFANTGTNIGGTASTTNQTGIISVTTGNTSTASQNFGIEKLPTAGGGSNTAVNQGGTATTNVPANTFTNTTNSSDPDGNVASIRLTTFPTGADKIIINGVPYTSANFPAGGVTIPTDANGNPTQTISVDPSFTGAGSVVINFVAIDNAGKESANTGNATMNFSALTVTGSVWNDTNGNAVKDGAEPFITNGSVYANLVDPVSHDVSQSVVVDASGNYSFSGVPANTNYQIILTSSSQTGNTNLTASTLPTGFANTGTNIGGTASTTNQTGIISVTTGATSTASQNFGIEKLPTAGSGANTAVNQGGANTTTVPANTFTNTTNSSDPDGNVTSIRITTFPTGADKIIINGVPYTSANFPVGGVTVPTDANGNPTQTISVDPSFTGAGSVVISFVAIDNAGKESANTGTATMNFSALTVTGSVWNDTNGNAVKDGAEPFITNGSVYANLVDPVSHDVIQSVVVDGSGNYSFSGVPANTNYQIILTTSSQTGNTNLTASILPTGFANTGTNIGGTLSTTNQTGIISVTTGTTSTASQNFGIEKLPTAGSGANTAVNQGGTNTTTVPANTFTNTTNSSDPDGNVASIRITIFPTGADKIIINGVPYTSANFPAGGVTIPADANGNPTQTISVDPSFSGAGSVIISFVAIDNAGKESANTGNATMNFSALTVSGNVWDDANGNATPDNSEAFITNGSMWVNLVDPVSHHVLQSVQTDGAGNYTFSGVLANTPYQIILSAGNQAGNTNLTTSTLPSGWVNTGTNLGGTASTTNQTGIISITTGATSPASQNFGIEHLPTAGSGTNSTLNPGGNNSTSVPASTFTNTANSTDPDGNVASIRITTFPTGADKITINGVPYTSANFPAGGVTVPTDVNGNPTQTITLDPSFGGVGSVTISFLAIDNAGKESANTGTAVMNFTDLTITGHVYDDLNGITDGLINGTPVSIASGQQLYANLVNHVSGTVVGSVAVAPNGTYTLGVANGILPNTSYDVVISTVQNSNTSALPGGWVSTAEGSGLGDGNINGTVAVNIGTTNIISNTDFGLDQTPITNPVTGTFINPGGTVTVPVLNGSDPEQGLLPGIGNLDTIIIRTLPSKGELYYNEVLVAAGDTIKNYNPALLVYDPSAGGGTVTFTYSEVDAALKTSTADAAVTLNISAPNLSPLISFIPSTIIGPTTVNVLASVSEFNNVATSGLVTVYIPKDNRYVLNYNPGATFIAGHPVSNSIWQFDKTSNPSYYILTTNSVLPANGESFFGFTTMVNPNNSVGQFRISIIILDYSGGELGYDAKDNSDDDILIYKY